MTTSKQIMESRAYRYAEDVLSGKIMAPKTIHQQAQHFLDDLKRAETGRWRYVYDPKRARLPVEFCERYLLPTAGEYDTFTFMDWQCFVDGQAFGWVDAAQGPRHVADAGGGPVPPRVDVELLPGAIPVPAIHVWRRRHARGDLRLLR